MGLAVTSCANSRLPFIATFHESGSLTYMSIARVSFSSLADVDPEVFSPLAFVSVCFDRFSQDIPKLASSKTTQIYTEKLFQYFAGMAVASVRTMTVLSE